FSLLARRGNVGLIATNTIAQGDTREVGLDRMVSDGFMITRAVQSRPWPAASANLQYAAVWGTVDSISANIQYVADGVQVKRISALLESVGRVDGNPARLEENRGIAFLGCKPYGTGFAITPDEARSWIMEDERNSEILFPYLNGEDLNSRP